MSSRQTNTCSHSCIPKSFSQLKSYHESGSRVQVLGVQVFDFRGSICLSLPEAMGRGCHPVVELRANLKLISHRCRLFGMAFVWALFKETIHLPLGCLQGGLEDKSGG